MMVKLYDHEEWQNVSGMGRSVIKVNVNFHSGQIVKTSSTGTEVRKSVNEP